MAKINDYLLKKKNFSDNRWYGNSSKCQTQKPRIIFLSVWTIKKKKIFVISHDFFFLLLFFVLFYENNRFIFFFLYVVNVGH